MKTRTLSPPTCGAALLCFLLARAWASAPVPVPDGGQGPIRIVFTLPKAGCVTLVVDDAQGVRVRNLIAETRFPAGKNLVLWDGCDEGKRDANGDLVRRRVSPGRYVARGIVHDGIHLSYEFSVYSPGTPPWFTPDGTGGWLADHTPASGIVYLPAGVSPYGGGEPQMAVGSDVGEAGHPQVWLDLTGRKIGGGLKMWGWVGSRSMARDRGPHPDANFYAYGASPDISGKPALNLFGLTRPKEPFHDALFPPRAPGEIVAVGRPLGPPVVPGGGSDAGPVFTVNSDKGAFYMMTADGLYVQTLGGDMRTHPLIRDPKLFRRGTSFDGYSFEDEMFHPAMTQTGGGSVYLVAGKEHSSLFHVTGLDTIRRRTFAALSLSAARLKSLPDREIEPARRQQANVLTVALLKSPPHVSDHLQSWRDAGVEPVRINGATLGSVAVSGDRLYAAWQTGDSHLLNASGGDWRYQFKHGGALDLMLSPVNTAGDTSSGGIQSGVADHRQAAAGDERLLVTRVRGAVRAVLFRPVAPGAPAGRSAVYSSPIGRLVFDDVEDVSAQVTLGQSGGDYEVSVPLSLLGIHPAAGDAIHGDIGILRGDGSQTIQRVYWNNLDTAIVSDVPSEARLQPSLWGVWQFQTQPAIVDGPPKLASKVVGLVPGLRYHFYLGAWTDVPDFSALKPDGGGVTDHFHADLAPRQTDYGVVFDGCLTVPADGVYTFHVSSDDGSRLFIDGVPVVSDGGAHGMDGAFGGIRLEAGEHVIRADYYQAGGGSGLTVSWSGPGVETHEIAPDDLSHAP